MSKHQKILEKILDGMADHNIPFRELCGVLKNLGFAERIRGDHHIFTREDVAEILNLQPKGSKAKAYQVKQVRELIIEYRLGATNDE
jgi:predicted RNA binding protein YcfA (HicA-like mRNA interferase family)